MSTSSNPAVKLSHVAWGSWRCGAHAATDTPDKLARLIEGLVELGITTIDLADIYGGFRVEGLVGRALALIGIERPQIQLVTKCGIRPVSPARPENGVKHYDTTARHIEASVAHSLEALRTDHVDLLLFHRPDPLLDADEVAATLRELARRGLVRAFGVSNHTPAQLDLLQSRLEQPLATNQIECSVLHVAPLFDGTLDQAQRLRMPPMFWSPLGGGMLLSPEQERDRRVAAALDAAGSAMGLGRAEAAIAWLATLPSRPVPVLGSCRLEHLASQAAAARRPMARQDWFRVLEASRGEPVA
ncbi:MAG TPA: aldo/keto reductase [Geminicoccaceae bacterium]|nr:aldo/keto reductase [Geminicoccus sp.]HMU50451.1 aldo/keto reductase [Geminicoccaceae bacterium]